MLTKPNEATSSTSGVKAALWFWTVLVAIGTGVAFGNLYASIDYFGNTTFNGGAFFGGLIAGLLSTVPFWALYSLGAGIHQHLVTLRAQLAESEPAQSPPSQRRASPSPGEDSN